MVALNIATDIPTGIVSVEELLIWALNVMSHLQDPNLRVIEGQGFSEIPYMGDTFSVTADNKFRYLGRCSIEVSKDHKMGNLKPWKYAIQTFSGTIPANFKAN